MTNSLEDKHSDATHVLDINLTRKPAFFVKGNSTWFLLGACASLAADKLFHWLAPIAIQFFHNMTS